ncbi:MAG: T9SS type A sorting domain-containing protein [Chitinophagaceae bacterium]
MDPDQFFAGTKARNGASYSATDLLPLKGANYYRLKQVDFDGHATYSGVQQLRFDKDKLATFALFPNPATDVVMISLGTIENAHAQYTIIDAAGREVQAGSFTKAQASTVQSLHVGHLPAGIYLVKITDGASQQSAKLKIK